MKNIKKFLFNGSSASVLIPKHIIKLLGVNPEESLFYITLNESQTGLILCHKDFSDKAYPLSRKLFISGNSYLLAVPPDIVRVLGFEPRNARFKVFLEGKNISVIFER